MEGPKFLKRSLWIVCKAAIFGWLLADVAMILIFAAANHWPDGFLRLKQDDFTLLVYFACTPSAYLISSIGHQSSLVNAFVVNGILGALIVAAFAAIWQVIGAFLSKL
jgi:hypothetical protein